MASVNANIERSLSRLPAVGAQVTSIGNDIAARATALLAEHRVHGDAHIEVTRKAPDVVVSLVDEAAISIEYGRGGILRANGIYIDPARGLYIIHRAAGL